MQFKKYSSIENTFDKDFIEKIRAEIPDNQEFVALEKSEQKILNRHINMQATELIKRVYF